MPAVLSLAAIKIIERAVDKLFDKAKARYLGPAAMDKRIYAGFKTEFSLPGIFMAAAREEQAVPEKKIIEALTRGAASYLDSYRASTKAHVVKRVESFLREAELAGVATDVKTVLGGELADVWKKTTSDVTRLISTEATNARNMGALEGIVAVNTAEGIEDPVVYFVVVRDNSLCDECLRLHMLPDEKTPRAWYLSEIGHGYHKRGQPEPKIGGLHPHCRCTMVTLMPGYGFGEDGMVKFISLDHDEVTHQRGLKKTEEPLEKSLATGDLVRELERHGWQQDRSTGEQYFRHPTITDAAFKIYGRPRMISISHSHGHKVPTEKVRYVLGDAGLKLVGGKIQPDPSHPFAEFYRQSGHLKIENEIKHSSWEPDAPPATRLQQVPLDKLISTKQVHPQDWQVAKYLKAFKTGQKAPHVSAMTSGDGTFMVDGGDEVLEAARQHGHTHAPVHVIG